jgi:rhodanese-related sulfurtransferase
LTAALDSGALVLDVRPAAEFVRGHAAGALFIDFDRRSFLPLVRLLVPADAPVVLVAPDADVARAAGALLESNGHRVADLIVPDAGLAATGARVERLPTIAVDELADRLAAPAGDFRLVDVRQSFEWKLGAIEGAVLVPLQTLAAESERWQPADELLCLCEQGVRSATAASFLRRRGFVNAKSVDGGVAAWANSGRPLREE